MLSYSHIKLIIQQTTLSEEMIAYKVGGIRFQDFLDLLMQLDGMPLVPQFVYCLVCDHSIERAEPVPPSCLFEVELDESCSAHILVQSLPREILHSRGKIQEGHPEIREYIE